MISFCLPLASPFSCVWVKAYFILDSLLVIGLNLCRQRYAISKSMVSKNSFFNSKYFMEYLPILVEDDADPLNNMMRWIMSWRQSAAAVSTILKFVRNNIFCLIDMPIYSQILSNPLHVARVARKLRTNSSKHVRNFLFPALEMQPLD